MAMSDCEECYAVPGADNIIDVIRPDNGLTWCFGSTEAEIKAREPQAVRMPFAEFLKAKAERQQTPIKWTRTTERKYQEMLEILPPAYWSGGAFLVGEPWDHCAATGAPRFAAYVARGGRYYTASRPLTIAELKAQL